MRTVTDVATWGVDTQSTDTGGRVSTLINVSAVASAPVQLVADATLTPEQPRNVLTPSIHTDIGKGTLVYVLAGLSVRGWDEAHVTFTTVASRNIQAVTALTQVHVIRTLIAV